MAEEKPVVKPKTAQDFVEAYNKLCKEYGFRVSVTPAFTARDDGTWSVVLQTAVGKMPSKVKGK